LSYGCSIKREEKFGDFDQNHCLEISFAGLNLFTCKLRQKKSRVKPSNKILGERLRKFLVAYPIFHRYFILNYLVGRVFLWKLKIFQGKQPKHGRREKKFLPPCPRPQK
jgi:hypothetical protein